MLVTVVYFFVDDLASRFFFIIQARVWEAKRDLNLEELRRLRIELKVSVKAKLDCEVKLETCEKEMLQANKSAST